MLIRCEFIIYCANQHLHPAVGGLRHLATIDAQRTLNSLTLEAAQIVVSFALHALRPAILKIQG